MFIVGATEISPGVMSVQVLNIDQLELTNGSAVETVYMNTDDYLNCW